MKKFIGIICISIISFAMTACGSANTSATSNSSSSEANKPSITTETTTEYSEPSSTAEEDSATTEVIEPVASSTDINDYINGDYFNIEGYFSAHGITISKEPVIMEESTIYTATYIGSNASASILIQSYCEGNYNNNNLVSNWFKISYWDNVKYSHIFDCTSMPIFNESSTYTTNYEGLNFSDETLKWLEQCVQDVKANTSNSTFNCSFCPDNICLDHSSSN